MWVSLSLALCVLPPAPSPAPAAAADIAEGDALYARRAEGAQGDRAQPAPVEAALQAYRRALAADPRNLEARYKVLRALHYRGAFCGDFRQRKSSSKGKRLGRRRSPRLEGTWAKRKARHAIRLAADPARPTALLDRGPRGQWA
jgi:hypothetical protein